MKLAFAAALSVLAFFASVPPGSTADTSALPQGFEVAPVLKSTTTADGDPLAYPRTDKPQIVSVVGTLAPGGRTALHQHPVPVFVYLLEGSLTVETEGGEPRHYKAGEAFLESVDRWHQAFNNGDTPARLLVVFVAEEGKPTTVAKD